jgi:hypothetical protein
VPPRKAETFVTGFRVNFSLTFTYLCHQIGIVIALREIKLENLEDSRLELYNFDSNGAY